MKTDDLISVLSSDAKLRQWPLAAIFAIALALGVLCSSIYFWFELGVRSNARESLSTWRFPFKFLVTLMLALPALVALYRLSRPGGTIGAAGLAFLVAPALLGLAVTAELITIPADLWSARWIGRNSVACLYLIPIMATGPLIASIVTLRYGAVTQPRLAALAAGLASAGIAATLYAAHCPDDSPLFVATWYTLATSLVTLVSLAVTPRLIRW